MIKHLKIALDFCQCLWRKTRGVVTTLATICTHVFNIMANGTFLKSGKATLNVVLTGTPYRCDY